MAADCCCERNMVQIINEVYKGRRGLKCVQKNRGFGINVKKCLCGRVTLPCSTDFVWNKDLAYEKCKNKNREYA